MLPLDSRELANLAILRHTLDELRPVRLGRARASKARATPLRGGKLSDAHLLASLVSSPAALALGTAAIRSREDPVLILRAPAELGGARAVHRLQIGRLRAARVARERLEVCHRGRLLLHRGREALEGWSLLDRRLFGGRVRGGSGGRWGIVSFRGVGFWHVLRH